MAVAATTVAHGDFVTYDSLSAWQQVAPSSTVLDFTGFTNNTFITDQYASLGVLFTDVDANIIQNASFTYLLDGSGLYGSCSAELNFDQPMRAFGAWNLTNMTVRAYLGRQLVYQGALINGVNFGGEFNGIVSTGTTFDRVHVYGPTTMNPPYFCGGMNFDNFWFSTVPAPGAVAVLAVGSVLGRPARRRR
ncbi:MAG: hypothetical protein SGJ09_04745, partial [Phycisphaerae bacterium]|nr:hypothetical protein [Phycisphaerae bacterium]